MSCRRREGRVLRVLLVSSQFPVPVRSGFTTRVHQLTRHLARRHAVTLLSYVDDATSDFVGKMRDVVRVEPVEYEWPRGARKRMAQATSAASRTPFTCRLMYTDAMQRAIDRLCATHKFDVVQLESSPLCAFRVPARPRLVIDEHNIEYEVLERMHRAERSLPRRLFNRVEAARFRSFERACWSRVDGVAVTSEREEAIVRSSAPETPIAVVPNGVDLDYFRPGRSPPEADTVVFNGALDYRPNLDAAMHLVEDIWPLVIARRPDARLTIIGRGDRAVSSRVCGRGVRYVGEVADVRPYLERAAVVAVPIRMGGGTRLKVVEGLAMAKAMVATPLGAEGVDVHAGEHLVLADTAEEFAGAVLELFENRDLAARLGAAARARMERGYGWPLVVARLEELYERVLARGSSYGRATKSHRAFRS